MPRPKVLDLFAGCGGLSLGFEQAGFDISASVEIDPIHSLVHHYNFPYSCIIPKDIRLVKAEEIIESTGEPIDVIVGGAPCQGFSMIGKRQLDDDRNFLVRNYLRLVEDLKPRYFIFENVKGITQGRHKKFLDEIIEFAESIGYNVLPWQVLDAREYGVPQARKRLILIGYREGETVPKYPDPTYHPAPENLLNYFLPRTPTTREVLEDLPDAEIFPELQDSDCVQYEPLKSPEGILRYYRPVCDSDWLFAFRRDWDPGVLTSSARTNHTPLSRARFGSTGEGETEPNSRFYKLRSDGYANTLRAGTDSSRGAFTSPRPLHYKYNRCITVREMARIHGYPDWFRLHSTKWHGARQIGNSVPPPMAYSVASEIIKALNITPVIPQVFLERNNEEFLYYDMTSACRYLGIDSPISGRTQRGTYTKRQQRELLPVA
jgi:DNA (cytosine-5)-methyltransferase 1